MCNWFVTFNKPLFYNTTDKELLIVATSSDSDSNAHLHGIAFAELVASWKTSIRKKVFPLSLS